jgi:hypothetical protein
LCIKLVTYFTLRWVLVSKNYVHGIAKVGYWYYLVRWWCKEQYRSITLRVQTVLCMLMNWDCLCTSFIDSACSKSYEICLLTDIPDFFVPLEDVLSYCMSVTVSAAALHAFAAVCWRRRQTDTALYIPSIILTHNYSNQKVHITTSDKKYPDTKFHGLHPCETHVKCLCVFMQTWYLMS